MRICRPARPAKAGPAHATVLHGVRPFGMGGAGAGRHCRGWAAGRAAVAELSSGRQRGRCRPQDAGPPARRPGCRRRGRWLVERALVNQGFLDAVPTASSGSRRRPCAASAKRRYAMAQQLSGATASVITGVPAPRARLTGATRPWRSATPSRGIARADQCRVRQARPCMTASGSPSRMSGRRDRNAHPGHALLVDTSFSMVMENHWLPVKRTARRCTTGVRGSARMPCRSSRWALHPHGDGSQASRIWRVSASTGATCHAASSGRPAPAPARRRQPVLSGDRKRRPPGGLRRRYVSDLLPAPSAHHRPPCAGLTCAAGCAGDDLPVGQ